MNYKTKQHLLLWILASSTFLALVIFFWGHLLEAIRTDNSQICIFISVFFLLAFLWNVRNVLLLAMESKLSESLFVELYRFENDDSDSVDYSILKNGKSLFNQHIKNLGNIYKYKVKSSNTNDLSQDNLVETLKARLDNRESWTILVSQLLITLGLIGTIAGLIISFTGLKNFDQMATAEMMGALQEIMAGMNTAYYTTIFGAILGGVFLRVLTQITKIYIDAVVTNIAEAAEVHVIHNKKLLDKISHNE